MQVLSIYGGKIESFCVSVRPKLANTHSHVVRTFVAAVKCKEIYPD
jgi:hypothetical protein